MIDIRMTIPEWDKIIKAHEKDIYLVLAAAMQTNRAMMFDQDGADNGKPKWAKLKWRKGRPLQARGVLRKSFAPQNNGITPGKGEGTIVRVAAPQVQIGTNLFYARLMNDGTTKMPGGVLRPTSAKALKIPIPKGLKGFTKKERKQGFIFRKSVQIPAREMDQITDQDEQEFADTLTNYLIEILSNV